MAFTNAQAKPSSRIYHCQKAIGSILMALLSGLVLLSSCRYQPGGERAEGQKLKVLSTTGIIADAVSYIGGNRIISSVLMGPGVDPHLYKASQQDVSKLSDANLIFYNGLHLEGKMGEVLHNLADHKPVVALSDGIAPNRLRQIEGFENTYDPHIWFDVMLWREAVLHIGQTLAEQDTVNADYYLGRTKTYCAELDSLDHWVRQSWQTMPAESRILVTAHDAFGYYGRAYGVEVRGLQGISTQAEYGLQDLTSLVNFVVQRRLKSVFIETSVPQKAIDAVVAGCKSKGWQLNLGPSLYSDALGEAGTPAGTYVGMVRANTNAIITALR
jgi:manganese/zinc/iron transport system substrate-binding protein